MHESTDIETLGHQLYIFWDRAKPTLLPVNVSLLKEWNN